MNLTGRKINLKTSVKGIKRPILGKKEDGVSQAVGVILILAVSISILSVAFSVVNHLPTAADPSATIKMGNFELVNSNHSSNDGWLVFSMVYSSGPTVSGNGSGLVISINGASYFYPLSSFNDTGNSWYPYLVAGSVISFDSSTMVTNEGLMMPPIASGTQITLEIVNSKKAVWTSSQSVQAQTVKPVLANSWLGGPPNKIFNIYASVFSEYEVTVTGNFSMLYGPGIFANETLSPVGGQEGYAILLPPVNHYSYYEIMAWITNSSTGQRYMVSEWYSIGKPFEAANSGGVSKSVIFTILINGQGSSKLSVEVGNAYYNYTDPASGRNYSFAVNPGTVITVNEQELKQNGQKNGGFSFAGYSGYSYSLNQTISVVVTTSGTLFLNYIQHQNLYSLAVVVTPKYSGTVSVTRGSTPVGSTSSSMIISNLTNGEQVTLSETPLMNRNTIPASIYHFVSYTGTVDSASQTITLTVTANNSIEWANFSSVKTYQMTININPEFYGNVYVNNSYFHLNVSTNKIITGIIPGTQFTLQATGLADYSFLTYSGYEPSSSSTIIVAVNSNITLTANFGYAVEPASQVNMNAAVSSGISSPVLNTPANYLDNVVIAPDGWLWTV